MPLGLNERRLERRERSLGRTVVDDAALQFVVVGVPAAGFAPHAV